MAEAPETISLLAHGTTLARHRPANYYRNLAGERLP